MIMLVKMNFNPNIAKEVDTDSAIIFENIFYWIGKNAANNKSFHDGDWWTYNSVDAFESLFNWLTTSKIRTCLDKLREKEIIKTGNYNKQKYDRTLWYAIGNNSICEEYKIHLRELTNGFAEVSKPIPNSNPNTNTDIPQTPKKTEEQEAFEELQRKNQALNIAKAISKAKKDLRKQNPYISDFQLKKQVAHLIQKQYQLQEEEPITNKEYVNFLSWLRAELNIATPPNAITQRNWERVRQTFSVPQIKCAVRLAVKVDLYWKDNFDINVFLRGKTVSGEAKDHIGTMLRLPANGDEVIFNIKQKMKEEVEEEGI